MKIKIIATTLLLPGLFFTACQKDSSANPELTTTSEDVATFQTLVQETDEEIDYQLETRVGDPENDCPTVTVSPDDGSYPRTVTIDYGQEGCEGPHGHIRKGVIEVFLTDSMSMVGAERTVSFLDFSIDDVQILGSKVLVNMGPNADDQPTAGRTVELQFLFPNDQEASWSASQTITLIEGSSTTAFLDNVWQIEGSGEGINRNGVPFSSQIVEPLIKPRSCPWIVSGIRTVTVNDLQRSLDFGDGECDRKATLTRADGSTLEILIRRWW
ncbi:MAG: hypothetical protein KDC44_19070 [Phaeodactylibacter sp.]|nr:hypothetical protein [Phaeodactylibacter sp.]